MLEGYDTALNRTVAVKRVRKAGKTVSRECQILSLVKGNKNCVQMLDLFYTADEEGKRMQNIVLEYVPDRLEDLINERHKTKDYFPLSIIRTLMQQLLSGLAFIHSKGICHRDIKPDNLMLNKEMTLKISDFGSAKLVDDTPHIGHIANRYYRAPELLFGLSAYGTKVDIWAAGCVMMELFTLHPLFPGRTEGTQLFEILAILGNPTREEWDQVCGAISAPLKSRLEAAANAFVPASFIQLFPSAAHYESETIEQAKDLVMHMLRWSPGERLDAQQALKHRFFDVIP